jgi:hypothetical protein
VENMKTVTLKIEQNGGEYYGYAIIKGIPDDSCIIKGSKDLQIGEMKIEFDELIDIIEVK